MKTASEISDYVFNLLDNQKTELFESAMMNNEDLADEVDGIMDFCIKNNLTSKEEFEAKWEELQPQHEELFRKLEAHAEGLEQLSDNVSDAKLHDLLDELEIAVEETADFTFGELGGTESKELRISKMSDDVLVRNYIDGDNDVVYFLVDRYAKILNITSENFLYGKYDPDDILIELNKELSKTKTSDRAKKFIFENKKVNIIRSLNELIVNRA